MEEFLTTLFQAIITAAVPIITAFIVRFLNLKSTQAKESTESALAKKYIGEVADAVSTAVLFVSQTYTDVLKKEDKFTASNQNEAFNRAMNEAKKLLTADASYFLTELYGDLNAYLTAKIEAEVKLLK